MSDLVGSTLGQYQVVELIGKGGMAAVYKAWQPSLRRHVALKVLDPQLASDASFVTRFHQEAVSAANLKHTNIVIIHDVGTQDGYNYIAMEHIDGSSLDERIRSQGALPSEQVVDITTQVGSALDYAHERGFIHRDIKPANVLIDQTGRVVLTDFGIVKALSGSGMTMSLTHSGSVIGTPHYMSPEQVKDEPLDHRSDLYSLGIVCYEMLSGRVPFNNATTHSVLFAQANDPPPPLRDVNSAVAPEVEAVVDKMLAKEPKARYNSASEFARTLSVAVDGEGAIVTAGGPAGVERRKSKPSAATPQRGSSPARRSRWPVFLLGIGVIGALLAVGVLAAVFLLGNEDSTQKRLEEAQAALAAGNAEAAAEEFTQVLEEDPENADAIEGQLEAASNLVETGQFDAAIAAYKKVLEQRPENTAALQGLGQAYEAKGEWEEAAGWYEKWTQMAAEDSNAFLALGNARFDLGEYALAVAAYEQAESTGADPEEVDRQLGLAHYELAQYDDAASRLQLVVSKNPEDFPSQRALGIALYRLDQIDQAVEHLNAAVPLGADRSDDALMDIYYELGNYYHEQGDYGQTIVYFEQALELDPEGKAVWTTEAQTKLDQAHLTNAMQDVILDLDFSEIVAEDEKNYAVAKTGQKLEIEGAVHTAEGVWQNAPALVLEMETRNLIANPSCEGDITRDWYFDGKSDGDVTQESTDSRYGSMSCKLTTPTADGHLAFWQSISVTANSNYAFSLWAKDLGLNTIPYLWIREAESGAGIATKALDQLSATDWTSYSLTITVPVGAKAVDFGVRIPDHASQGALLVDALQVEQKPFSTTYSDGDQGIGYSWDGTPQASPSVRAASFVQYRLQDVNLAAGSIAVWLKPGKFYNWPYIFGAYPEKFDAYLNAGGDVVFRVYDEKSENGTGISHNIGAEEGNSWHHLVYVWSQTDIDGSNLWLFVNGTLVGEAANTHWPFNVPRDYTRIQAGAQRVVGSFTTFDRALTADEVAALYRKDAPQAQDK